MKNIEIIFVINLNHLETTLAKKYLFLTKIIRQLNSRKKSGFSIFLLHAPPLLWVTAYLCTWVCSLLKDYFPGNQRYLT